MKKILASLLLFLLSVSSIYAYTPTLKDEKTLNSLYKQIDVLIDKKPDQAEKLHQKIEKILPTLSKDDRTKYLIWWLSDYLSDKLNESQEYEVIKIIDWDTIKIKYEWEEINIRMIGIDSPENSTTRYGYIEKNWDLAKEKIEELIGNNKITIELDDTQWKYDKYNRLLAYVFVSWININQKMIEVWYANEYTYNKSYKYQKEFKEAEKNAKNKKVGIWKEVEENILEEEPKELENNKNYFTWPRWGCYYINSNGNKSYVDRSYCGTGDYNDYSNSSNYSNGRTYYQWSRGGCYYYNSNWNKSYVSRSLCN